MAIFAAVRLGDYDMVQELLKSTDPNIVNRRKFSNTLLHYAINNNFDNIAALLLTHGANQTFKNLFGEIPLHLAVRKGNLDLVKLLFSYGAEVESRNNLRETPMHNAARMGHIEIGRFLLYQQAGIDCQNINGDTPLHYSAFYNFPAFAVMLLQEGADPALLNNNDMGFLDIAREKNQMDFLMSLEEFYHRDTVARLTSNLVTRSSFLL